MLALSLGAHDMTIAIDRVDHIVLNCRDLETTVAWYQRVLGMKREEFGPDRHTALKFGNQKFNVRPSGTAAWVPRTASPVGVTALLAPNGISRVSLGLPSWNKVSDFPSEFTTSAIWGSASVPWRKSRDGEVVSLVHAPSNRPSSASER